jgi:hypothetical protein
MDNGHAVGGISKGPDASAAYPAGLSQFQLLPSKPSTDLFNFLTSYSAFDPRHHSALRRCEINVAANTCKWSLVSVSQVKELFQFDGAAMQPIEIPDDDSIDEASG